MTSLIAIPEDMSLWEAPYSFSVLVDAVNLTNTGKKVKIALAGYGDLYHWYDGVIWHDASVSQETTLGTESILVTITVNSPPSPGSVVSFSFSYQDDSTPKITKSVTYASGFDNLSTAFPAPEQGQVPPQTSVVFSLTAPAPFVHRAPDVKINGVSIMANPGTSGGTFLRPDYLGEVTLLSNLAFLKFTPRQSFKDGLPVKITVVDYLTPDNEQIFTKTFEWTFHVAAPATVVPAPARTPSPLDQPYPVGIVEVFRQVYAGAVLRPFSQVPLPVLALYAVQNSSLSSLAAILPGAPRYMTGIPHLKSHDISNPADVAAELKKIEVFWLAFIRYLVESNFVPLSLADLIDRAWSSGVASDQSAAVAAALLYGTRS